MPDTYYDETYIEDTFREVLEDTAPFKDDFKGLSLSWVFFPTDDSKPNRLLILLEEYAPKLFTIVPNEYELHKVMLNWGVMSHNYIHSKNNFGLSIQKQILNNLPTLRSNKSPEEKLGIFKNNIISLYKATGGNAVATKKGKELKKMLKDAFLNPEDYIPKKPTIREPSIEPIKDYLKSLGLDGKSELIEQFSCALSNL